MPLFKTAKRKKAAPAPENKAELALDLLCGLDGYWYGVRREWDPDRSDGAGSVTHDDKDVRMLFELNLEGTHLITHTDTAGTTVNVRNFDVWGHDATSEELIRTIFIDGARQINAFAVGAIEEGRDRRIWRLVLETVSWDEGRPCEIRYEISRSRGHLDLKFKRRLINKGSNYQMVSRVKLVRR